MDKATEKMPKCSTTTAAAVVLGASDPSAPVGGCSSGGAGGRTHGSLCWGKGRKIERREDGEIVAVAAVVVCMSVLEVDDASIWDGHARGVKAETVRSLSFCSSISCRSPQTIRRAP